MAMPIKNENNWNIIDSENGKSFYEVVIIKGCKYAICYKYSSLHTPSILSYEYLFSAINFELQELQDLKLLKYVSIIKIDELIIINKKSGKQLNTNKFLSFIEKDIIKIPNNLVAVKEKYFIETREIFIGVEVVDNKKLLEDFEL